MNDRQRRLYEMFLRVISFMTANAANFITIPLVDTIVTTLDVETQKIAALAEEKVTDTATAKDATIFRGDARDALRDAMQDIADMWRSMADEHGGAVNRFRVPYGSDQLLIDTARSFADELPLYQAAFIARGMPAGFITDLTTKTNTFAAKITGSENARRERVGTNAGFEDPIKACKTGVEKLEPIVKMVYRTNPQKLAEWLVASHVERPPKSSSKP